jgi:hypothetical protein
VGVVTAQDPGHVDRLTRALSHLAAAVQRRTLRQRFNAAPCGSGSTPHLAAAVQRRGAGLRHRGALGRAARATVEADVICRARPIGPHRWRACVVSLFLDAGRLLAAAGPVSNRTKAATAARAAACPAPDRDASRPLARPGSEVGEVHSVQPAPAIGDRLSSFATCSMDGPRTRSINRRRHARQPANSATPRMSPSSGDTRPSCSASPCAGSG